MLTYEKLFTAKLLNCKKKTFYLVKEFMRRKFKESGHLEELRVG
jgi:hypothetical protein